ncbi:MAG: DUF4872 domain-containing protein, partial [Candidatus Thorarchaeota archaeon]
DRFHGTAEMALTQLQKARASEYPPFPAMNQMVRFTFPETLTPLESIIPDAIRENADALLNPPISNVGVKGIVRWSKELVKYPKMFPNPRDLVHALMMHFIYIETGGSGGAIFRQIYADFLKEAGELMNSDPMLRAAEDFRNIVKMWRNVANGLLPEGYPALTELREIQWSINEVLESKGLKMLDSVRKKSEKVPRLMDEAARKEIPDFSDFIKPVCDLLKEISEKETKSLTTLSESVK